MSFESKTTVALSRRLNFRRYLSVSVGRLKRYGFTNCATLRLAGRGAPIFLHFCASREVGIRYFKKWNPGWMGWDAAGVRSAASELGVEDQKLFDLLGARRMGWWEPWALVHASGIVEQHDSSKTLPDYSNFTDAADMVPALLPCWREDERDASAWGKIPMSILTQFNEWLSTLYENQEHHETNRAKQIRCLARVKRIGGVQPDTTEAGGCRV
jgi:hypothetical protein